MSQQGSGNRINTLHRRLLLTGAGAIAAGAAISPGPLLASRQEAATPVSGGTLAVGVQGDPTELDPALSNLAAAGLIVDLVYEGLVHEGPELVAQPAVAERWETSDDGLTYTFHLRPGVMFHHGRELTSDDVLFAFERVMAPATASPWLPYTDGIESIDAPDDATVVFTLAAPDAAFLAGLSRKGLVIVPRDVAEEEGLGQRMVGTGPFAFVEYVPNTSLALERHGDYWDEGKPFLDGLDILIVPDDTARTTALVSDTVQLIEQVPHRDIELLEQTAGVELTGGVTTNLRWLVFNLRREPFDRLDVRRAIASGIVRQPIIDAAVFGYGEPLIGMYPETFWFGYVGEIPEPDPEGATAALTELGLPEDFRPGLLTWSQYGFLTSTSVVVQEQVNQMGIESEIESEENASYIERFYSYDFDIAVMGAAGYVDPNDFLQQNFASDQVNNTSGYSNPEIDELLAAGMATTDQDERAAIYGEIQQILIDDAPWVNLYTSSTYEGVSDRVRGFTHYLSGSLYSLRETWLEG